MDERQALLDTIIASPEDDTPRLVFADWLEENGEGDRAEFIRVQCELASYFGEPYPDGGRAIVRPVTNERLDKLQLREARLYKEISHSQFAIPEPQLISVIGLDDTLLPNDPSPFVNLHRGFVERFTGPLDVWLAHGPAIVRRHPIQPHAGMVTDRKPSYSGREMQTFRWFRGDDRNFPMHLPRDFPMDLPKEIFALIEGQLANPDPESIDDCLEKHFSSREDAMIAISVAIIAWARLTDPVPPAHPV